MDVTKILRNIRDKYGYSQEYMARELHISPSTYCKIEGGEIHLSVERAKQLAKLYQIEPSCFLDNGEGMVSNAADHKSEGQTVPDPWQSEKEFYDNLVAEKDRRINYLQTELSVYRKRLLDLISQVDGKLQP